MTKRNVRWIFNPPYSSHMGGAWERMIRTTRKVLDAILTEQVLDDEGLPTLLCEVEAIINGRPLTKVSDDPKDVEALTANHLLLLRDGPQLSPGIFAKENVYCKRRWKQVQYLADVFWRRWTKEYLPALQERSKWRQINKNLAVGDIVLVVDVNSPRAFWPIGRVQKVFKDVHGLVRQAIVKTKGSTLTRPISKLCLLEECNK
ncbi:hypothetical protein QZH41_000086 [Actinostola sp. cb2023]|nr:hypothetical protein QZH41_000086 [Actinostola sp. cb2023]